MQEIQENGIRIYSGEVDDEDETAESKELRVREREALVRCNYFTPPPPPLPPSLLKDAMPFAVVGSNTLLEVNGKRVRGRLYPWGVVEGERRRKRLTAAAAAVSFCVFCCS